VRYKWAHGYEINTSKVAAAVFAKTVASLGKDVTAESVVEAARSSASEIHDLFDWSNTKAAHKWRLHQARQALQALEFVVVKDERPTRALQFVGANDEGRGRYVPFEKLTQDQIVVVSERLRSAITYAMAALDAFERAAKMRTDKEQTKAKRVRGHLAAAQQEMQA